MRTKKKTKKHPHQKQPHPVSPSKRFIHTLLIRVSLPTSNNLPQDTETHYQDDESTVPAQAAPTTTADRGQRRLVPAQTTPTSIDATTTKEKNVGRRKERRDHSSTLILLCSEIGGCVQQWRHVCAPCADCQTHLSTSRSARLTLEIVPCASRRFSHRSDSSFQTVLLC